SGTVHGSTVRKLALITNGRKRVQVTNSPFFPSQSRMNGGVMCPRHAGRSRFDRSAEVLALTQYHRVFDCKAMMP
ncbi:MAG TPA: hypothetical protein VIQ28_03210, partial [Burkholderiales bacterium]